MSYSRIVCLLAAAAAFFPPLSHAQFASPAQDQVRNWPAPLYWQPPTVPEGTPAHPGKRGFSLEQVTTKAAPPAPTPAIFVAVTACRLVDTRVGQNQTGPWGPPALAAYTQRSFNIPANPACGIPSTALAYSLNFTVVPSGPVAFFSAWAEGSPYPGVSTLNDLAGTTLANAAIVPAGANGGITVVAGNPTDLIIDINGFYAMPSSLPSTGTAAAPALTFGDPATGLFSDTAGTVSIATGGVKRLTLRSDGDLELPGSLRKGGVLFLHNVGGPQNYNTAVGLSALANAPGALNTATGAAALQANTAGTYNTANGAFSLSLNTTGQQNTAMGRAVLDSNTTGSSNTGVGDNALGSNTTGSRNIALGATAGENVTTGSYNIHIGNVGAAADTNMIRIGDLKQTQTFIAGIRGVTTVGAAIPVVIDTNGQLGTVSSSRGVKRDIRDMRDTTSTIMSLHPVEFRYQAHGPDAPIQFGLIAEEVAGIAPELVAHNAAGEIETVYYDKVNAMLLNEVQKAHRQNEAQGKLIENLESRLAELENRLK